MNFFFLKKLLIFFYSIILIFFTLILYFFSGFKSKKKNLWGFGSLAGQEFRGNSKYLYKYLEKNHKEIEIYWLAKSLKEDMKLKKQGINSIYAYSFSSFKKIASTNLFFCTHGFVDLIVGLTRKAKIIMLGHMTYTIKNNFRSNILKKKSFLSRIFEQIKFGYFYIRKIDFGIYSSEFSKKNLITNDKWFPQKKFTFGLPKSDYLTLLKDTGPNKNFFKKKIDEDDKIILFLPTRRNDKNFDILNFGFSSKKFKLFAKQNKCSFFISHHPTNANKQIPNYHIDRLQFINIGGNSIDDALSEADLLITDYGSIFADFLIFNKPIIFTKFDHKKYIDEIGLKIDFESLPGPKVDNWENILFNVKELLYENDKYLTSREKWINNLYEKSDGKNCERIVQHFKTQ